MRFERAHQVFALLNTHISYALVLFVLLLLLFVFFSVFSVCVVFFIWLRTRDLLQMCILCECPASTASFVCKCERGRECAQQRVIESYRFFYCLFFSALSSSFSSLAFIKPPWGDQTKMRKRSKSNTQKTVCATVELYYFDISASFELYALLCFVLFLLHPVKWMYSNRNVVIQWIKYVLCLIFMPFIHWHIHDIQTLHYFVALICHIRYIYVYFILFSVYRWLSFGPMCFFPFALLSLSLFLFHIFMLLISILFSISPLVQLMRKTIHVIR